MTQQPVAFGSDDKVELWRRIDVLRRRWWLLALCGLLGAIAGWWMVSHRVPEYYAESTVQRQEDRSPLDVVAPQNQVPNLLSDQEIIRRGAVLTPVIDSLGLRVVWPAKSAVEVADAPLARTTPDAVSGEYEVSRRGPLFVLSSGGTELATAQPGEWLSARGVSLLPAGLKLDEPAKFIVAHEDEALAAVRANLDLGQLPNTNLIRIGFHSPDPRMTAAVANAVAVAYMKFSGQKARQEAKLRTQFIRDQMAQVHDSLLVAQGMLASGQQRTGVLDRESNGSQIGTSYADAESEVRNLRFQRTMLQDILTDADSSGLSDTAVRKIGVVGAEMVPTAPDLYHMLQQAQAERIELTSGPSGRTVNSSRVQSLDSRITGLKQDLREATRQALRALDARVGEAERRLADAQTQRSQFPQRVTEVGSLDRRVEAIQKTADMLTERYYEAQIAEVVGNGKVEVVDLAEVPRRPVNQQGYRGLVLFLLAGVFGGAVLAFLIEYGDRRVRTAEDVTRASQLQLIAGIPYLPHMGRDSHGQLAIAGADGSAGAEAFRMLRTSVQFALGEGPRVVAVTSSAPGEGKSLIASNYAAVVAKQGRSVLLVDADLRRPTIHTLFGLRAVPGLADRLLGEDVPARVVSDGNGAGTLHVLTCGTHTQTPAELLESREFRKFIDSARNEYDLVVIDTPPILAVADAAALMAHVDGVLLVVRAGMSDRFALTHATSVLRQVNAPMLGAVLNGIQSGQSSVDYGGYYGKYDYTSNGENGASRDVQGNMNRLRRLLSPRS